MDSNLVFQSNFLQGDVKRPAQYTPDKNYKSGDLLLWKNFQAGSESAYEEIYRNYALPLYGFGLKLTKNKELIKDSIQDLFLEIWRRKHKLAAVKSIKSYLFKSFRRKLISAAVKKRKTFTENATTSIPKCLQNTSFETDWISAQQFDQQMQKLKWALSKLTSRQQEIIQLKFYSLLSYVEISEVMELSMKGTYKLMGRSICRLRKYMDP